MPHFTRHQPAALLRAAGISFLFLCAGVQAESLWDKTKAATGSAVGVIGDSAKSLGNAISGEKTPAAELRASIDQMEAETLQRLFRSSTAAKERFDKAAGHAVFDTRKLSLLITSGFGSGVAVARSSGQRTYMKMATGGVNIGYGAQSFQVVFLFPDQTSFDDFLSSGWDANADAVAAANEDKTDAGLQLQNGITVYQLNAKGLALSAALTGTKYWQDEELNRP